jgi:hypothetical protein
MNNQLAAALAVALAFATPAVHAEKAGAYVGTFEVSGSERDPKITYKATVNVNLPVTERTADAINADLLGGDGPPATIKVTQWDYYFREKSADSSGTFVETRCALAAPVEFPAMVMGVLNVDLRKKNYSMSLTLTPMKEVPVNCSSTRQKSFKKTQAIGFAMGTGAPGMQADTPQPLSDPTRLVAKFTMDASTQSKGAVGPVVQAWDLKLTQ